jgi:uncharacterized membrane protein (UPF0127 family)
MSAAALLLLMAQQSMATAPAVATPKCLPAGDGFLTMHLRGSIEADVRWREPELDCAGMQRPDGRGLRVRFAGTLPEGGALAVLFAAPDLPVGMSAKGVPVNVTLIDDAGERIFGTQGDSRCTFDTVEQQGVTDASPRAPSYRVSASGFCVAPARAVDSDGAVLLTRFDFAGLVTTAVDDEAADTSQLPPHFARLPTGEVELATQTGTHAFEVWIAADDTSRERGLMYVKTLARDRGMLFLFEPAQPVAFWMKDTPLALDLLFIGPDRTIESIVENATPNSLRPMESQGPVIAVLEVAGGTARRIGLSAGDAVRLPTLPTTGNAARRHRSAVTGVPLR